MSFCEFFEISRNTFFTEHIHETAFRIWICIGYYLITTSKSTKKKSLPSPWYLYSSLRIVTNLDNSSAFYFGYLGKFFFPWAIHIFHFKFLTLDSWIIWILTICTSWPTKLKLLVDVNWPNKAIWKPVLNKSTKYVLSFEEPF